MLGDAFTDLIELNPTLLYSIQEIGKIYDSEITCPAPVLIL